MSETAIDWTTKPPPWCWIGPQFRQQCLGIVADQTPVPPTVYQPRPAKPERKHRDAVPPDPKYQVAKAEREAIRAAEIAAAKESLRLKHEARADGVTRNHIGQHRPRQRYFEDDDADEVAQAIVRAAKDAAE